VFCAGVGSRIDDAISSVCILGPSAFQSQAGFNSMMIWVIDIIVNLGKRKEMTAASGQEGGQGYSQGKGGAKTTSFFLNLLANCYCMKSAGVYSSGYLGKQARALTVAHWTPSHTHKVSLLALIYERPSENSLGYSTPAGVE
jgi:hypothetical protein